MRGKRIKRTDIMIIVVLLAISAALYFLFYNRTEMETAVASVEYRGEVIAKIPLNKDEIYEFEGDDDIHVTLEVKEGAIRFTDARCPDKICQNTGFVSLDNQTAICMPAKMLVRVDRIEP